MTPQETAAKKAKTRLQRQGKTVKAWAAENGYDSNRVYRILGGFEKCLYGKSHEIAVKLGLKPADPAAEQLDA